MSSKVFTQIPYVDPALVEAAGKSSVADLHEALGVVPGRQALLDPAIAPLNPGQRIAGQAVTVFTYPGDALLGHQALSMTGPGQVLVAATAGQVLAPMFAELTSLAARENGLAGVVADGPIRDADALLESRFPVWHRGRYAGHTTKRGPGEVNVPIVCGGVTVMPGDVVVADGDGVICIPRRLLEATLAGAAERAAREEKVRAAIADGATLFDLIGLRPALEGAGVEVVDGTWEEAQR